MDIPEKHSAHIFKPEETLFNNISKFMNNYLPSKQIQLGLIRLRSGIIIRKTIESWKVSPTFRSVLQSEI